jgi:uncharacterized membrane protein YkvA (DUF1232 family)
MPINIAFQLTDVDLEYFRKAMRDVRANAHSRDEHFIISAASRLVKETGARELPEFVRERLTKLEGLIRMLEDVEWRLEGDHRARVLGAIAYFAEPKDLVPDQIPGLGFLDDAIMIKILEEEFRHELWGFRQFAKFRAGAEQRPWTSVARTRLPERLAEKRRQIRGEVDRKKRERRTGWW